MRITWYGHACFKFDFSQGPYVVTDPFDDHVGYPLCREEADVVTVSHAHSDHNYTESLRGNFTKITRPGLFTFDDLIVQGVKSYHDAENGGRRGDNVIYIFESDDVRIAHLGDLGHEPNLKQYAALTNIDVLLIPIGGYYTIDTDTALKIIDHVRPRVVIPMHFKTPLMDFPITDEKRFVEKTGAVYWDKRWVEVTRENINSLPRALVLKYQD